MAHEHVVIDAEKHYQDRLREFESESVEPGGIVLLGSSHFEWFETGRFLPRHRFVNRGIASDRLGIGDRGILHRLDVSVFDLAPSQVIFNNGVNDLGELWRTGEPPFDEIVAAHEQVIMRIRRRLPDVPLLVINELPTRGRFDGINPLAVQFNPHVATNAARHACAHLDFHSVVVDQAGRLRAELTTDGLHLNDEGYALFAERLEQNLAAG